MTERFKFICDDENCYFKDNDKAIDCYEAVELLNTLNDENEQLKKDCSILVQSNQEYRKENEKLKKENHGIQDKVIRLLDYVEVKQCVTRTEIKKWWNGDVE